MEYVAVDKNMFTGSGAHRWLIRVENEFYVVSAVLHPEIGPQTSVFHADVSGKITDFDEVVQVDGTMNHEEAIAELLETLSEREEEEDSNTIEEADAYVLYNDMLDEIYPAVEFGDLSWNPSRVLKEMDPIAYETGFIDWLDSEGLELE